MHSGLIYHEVSGAQWSSIGARNLKVYGHGYTEYFLCPTVVTRRKNTFHKIISLTPSWIFLLSGLLNWARLTRKEWRKMFFVFSRAWDKEKVLSPHEESSLRPSYSALRYLPLSHRDFTVSQVYYEVHMTRVIHTAKISNVDSVMFVNRIREMVSFELGKVIEKDVVRFVMSAICPLMGCTRNGEGWCDQNGMLKSV